MLESDFAGLQDIREAEHNSNRPRGRSYQIRLKQKRPELEDYELSTRFTTQEKPLVREVSAKSRRHCIGLRARQWL
jgi:hypothetical protein